MGAGTAALRPPTELVRLAWYGEARGQGFSPAEARRLCWWRWWVRRARALGQRG